MPEVYDSFTHSLTISLTVTYITRALNFDDAYGRCGFLEAEKAFLFCFVFGAQAHSQLGYNHGYIEQANWLSLYIV